MATDDVDYTMDGDQVLTGMIEPKQLSIGIGCSRRAGSDDIVRLIRASIDPIPSGTILATLDLRASIGEIVASMLGLRLATFPASTLADIAGTTTRSSLAFATTRTPNVAEASALASLGPAACLIVPQRKGHLCTCAVAALPLEVLS